jgi:hypothetical protein
MRFVLMLRFDVAFCVFLCCAQCCMRLPVLRTGFVTVACVAHRCVCVFLCCAQGCMRLPVLRTGFVAVACVACVAHRGRWWEKKNPGDRSSRRPGPRLCLGPPPLFGGKARRVGAKGSFDSGFSSGGFTGQDPACGDGQSVTSSPNAFSAISTMKKALNPPNDDMTLTNCQLTAPGGFHRMARCQASAPPRTRATTATAFGGLSGVLTPASFLRLRTSRSSSLPQMRSCS